MGVLVVFTSPEFGVCKDCAGKLFMVRIRQGGDIRLHAVCLTCDVVQEPTPEGLPAPIARRPYEDDKPDGDLESDRDYFENNRDLAIKLLDRAVENARE
jgi:hypothetical protein